MAPTASDKRRTLKQRLQEPGLISAPGVFEMISARIADRMGFDALYMTGYGAVASYLGLPDAGLASYTDMVGRAGSIAGGTSTPLIADADTGYGGLLNVDHTVKGYEAAGIAAIQLEDQEFPKKCGHTPGRRVIPAEDMAKKIRVATQARDSDDFLIVARTDALTTLGLDEALRRAEMYAEAGADIIFVEAPETVEQMEKICRTIDKPLLANMVEGGKTPLLPKEELEKLGYKIAIYPGTAFLAMGRAVEDVYSALHDTGTTGGMIDRLYKFEDFSRLMGFERVWDFDKKHAD
ncbi:MAG: isocitrate lyase/PEP mutase family protein [Alphaproteobacteria bacterium]|nr:isocitrate lyase/PEP mutase family protein [Alphaproteobacteria bacterium]MDX5367787.1 isocitrate lyase/PEP mutase family protein [Alphaproteobacteria bacterium]MDX5462673.1 isocitrate lyase/PEP mutase family protein [Alphaproteobacteria bacterium]